MRMLSGWFLLAMATIALLIVGWLFVDRSGPAPAVTARSPDVEGPPPARPAPSPKPAVETPSALSREMQGRMRELCGYGKVDILSRPATFELAADKVLLKAAMLAERSGDEYLQALGYSLHAIVAGDAADRGVIAQDKVCAETALCEDQARTALRGAALPNENAILQMARTTRDPRVYVAALRLCHPADSERPPEACGDLSLQHWAEIDSANAEPWLLLARVARQRNDAAGVDTAMQRAAAAQFFDRRALRYGELLGWVEGGTGPVRSVALSKLLAAEERQDLLDVFGFFSGARSYCDVNHEFAQARRAACDSLARVLWEQSVDVLGQSIAEGVLTVSDPTYLQRRWSERDWSQRALDFGYFSDAPGFARTARPNSLDTSCAAAERAEAWLRGVARNGQVAYLREFLAPAANR